MIDVGLLLILLFVVGCMLLCVLCFVRCVAFVGGCILFVAVFDYGLCVASDVVAVCYLLLAV